MFLSITLRSICDAQGKLNKDPNEKHQVRFSYGISHYQFCAASNYKKLRSTKSLHLIQYIAAFVKY